MILGCVAVLICIVGELSLERRIAAIQPPLRNSRSILANVEVTLPLLLLLLTLPLAHVDRLSSVKLQMPSDLRPADA